MLALSSTNFHNFHTMNCPLHSVKLFTLFNSPVPVFTLLWGHSPVFQMLAGDLVSFPGRDPVAIFRFFGAKLLSSSLHSEPCVLSNRRLHGAVVESLSFCCFYLSLLVQE